MTTKFELRHATCGWTDGGEFWVRPPQSYADAIVMPRNEAIEMANIIANHEDPSRGIQSFDLPNDFMPNYDPNGDINTWHEEVLREQDRRDNAWRERLEKYKAGINNLRDELDDKDKMLNEIETQWLQKLKDAQQIIDDLKAELSLYRPYGDEVKIDNAQTEEASW